MANYTAIQSANLITTAQNLKIQAYDKLLQMKSLPESVFFKLGGNVIDKMTPIPSAWLLKAPPESSQAHQTNFPLLMYLSGNETAGNQSDQINSLEDPIVKEFTAYYNDVSKAVKINQYGIDFLDTAPYAIKEKISDLLATYWKELMDYYMQHAILWKYSPNLLQSPTNLSVVPHKNTIVKGVPYGDQPFLNYNTNANFYSSVIASNMDAAVASHASKYDLGFDVPFALAVTEYANYQLKMKPFNLGGRNSYIWALPSSQVTRTINPMTTAGFGAVWMATTKLNTEEMSLPGCLGRCRNVIFVENPRAPTAKTFGTGSGSGSGVGTSSPTNSVLSVTYLKPGENDQRYTSGDVWEPGFLLGQQGMVEIDNGVHTENEIQDFKKYKAVGMFNVMGFNRVEYTTDTPDSSSTTDSNSLDNFSSAVCWNYKQTAQWNLSGQTN